MKIKICSIYLILLCARVFGQHPASLDLIAELSRLEKLGLARNHPEIIKIKALIDAQNHQQVGETPSGNSSSKSINDYSTVIFNENIKSIGILITAPPLANKENEELNIKNIYLHLSDKSVRKRVIAFYPSRNGLLIILSPNDASEFVESLKKQSESFRKKSRADRFNFKENNQFLN